MTLLLTEAEVRQALDFDAVIGAVERSLVQAAAGEVDVQPRRRVKAPGTVLHTMSAALHYAGVLGCKTYVSTRSGAEFWLALYRQGEPRPTALLQADWLGRVRTGAATAAAVRTMTIDAPMSLGVFGCGKQAETQIAAIGRVRPLREVLVYSRTPGAREEFAASAASSLQLVVRAVGEPAEAAECDVVATVTTSGKPVLRRAWLPVDALVCAVGANWPNRREIPEQVVAEAEQIVCDDVLSCHLEAGDLLMAEEAGLFDWSRANPLASLVSGGVAARTDGLRLYKSVGSALFDVAAAVDVVERARNLALGREVGL